MSLLRSLYHRESHTKQSNNSNQPSSLYSHHKNDKTHPPTPLDFQKKTPHG